MMKALRRRVAAHDVERWAALPRGAGSPRASRRSAVAAAGSGRAARPGRPRGGGPRRRGGRREPPARRPAELPSPPSPPARGVVATDFDGIPWSPTRCRTRPRAAWRPSGRPETCPVSRSALVSGRDVAASPALRAPWTTTASSCIGSHGADHLPAPTTRPATSRCSTAESTMLAQAPGGEAIVGPARPGPGSAQARLRWTCTPRALTEGRGRRRTGGRGRRAAAPPGCTWHAGKAGGRARRADDGQGHRPGRPRRVRGAGATLYLGDDVTDERAFEALDPASGDVTVKVGDGDTAATWRVDDVADVVAALQLFVEARTQPARVP